jgi:tight adherence protein B
MPLSLDEMLYAAVFTTALLLAEGMYYLVLAWRRGPTAVVSRRLRMIRSQGARATLQRLRREDQDPVSRVLVRAFPFVERLITQAGLTVRISRVMAGAIVFAAVCFVVTRALTVVPLPLAAIAALAAGPGLPLLWIVLVRARRLRRFGEQLPDTLDLIVRSLLAGHPMAAAMHVVSEEVPDPMGTEFGIAVDEMTYGLSLEEAISNIGARVPNRDLRFFVLAVQIHHSAGGNLGEVLSNLSTVIRDRFRMYAKVRAVSAEGRLSAIVISALPLVVFALLNVVNTQYFGSVWHDPLFMPLMITAMAFLAVGIVSVIKIVNIRV